jgi:ketosteroid isomerase-like protein
MLTAAGTSPHLQRSLAIITTPMEAIMNVHAMPTKDDIIALEKSYWEAIKAKDGRRTAALSGKSALVTGAQGVQRIEKEKMGKMTEEGNWSLESYAFDEVEVSTPSPDVAIIAYTVSQDVTMDGKAQTLRAADSSVWIRGTDGWACHAHSESFLK